MCGENGLVRIWCYSYYYYNAWSVCKVHDWRKFSGNNRSIRFQFHFVVYVLRLRGSLPIPCSPFVRFRSLLLRRPVRFVLWQQQQEEDRKKISIQWEPSSSSVYLIKFFKERTSRRNEAKKTRWIRLLLTSNLISCVNRIDEVRLTRKEGKLNCNVSSEFFLDLLTFAGPSFLLISTSLTHTYQEPPNF